MNSNQEMLNRNHNELIELKHVLQKDGSFFDEAADFEKPVEDEPYRADKPLVEKTGGEQNRAVKLGYFDFHLISKLNFLFSFVTGVIAREKFGSFERVLWRVLRGNLFMKHAEIEEKIKEPSSVRISIQFIPNSFSHPIIKFLSNFVF